MNKIAMCIAVILMLAGAASVLHGQTLIYMQDFYSAPPAGWTVDNQGWIYPYGWYYYEGIGYPDLDDTKAMGHTADTYLESNNWVFLQAINLTAGYDYHVEFYQKVLAGTHKLQVTVGSQATDTSQTTILYQNESLSNGSYLQRVSSLFTPIASGDYYFAFRCYSSQNMGTLYVDNVAVYVTIPPMPNPTAFSATAVSNQQIDLDWTKFSPTDNVMVAANSTGTFGIPASGTVYNVDDAIPGGGTVIYKGSADGYNHTGLTANTTYYYKAWTVGDVSMKDGYSHDIRAIVYSTGVTASAKTMRTPVDIVQGIDYTENFDGVIFPPVDWFTQPVSKVPGDWLRYTVGYNPNCAPAAGAGMAGYDSWTYGGVRGILVTPPLNLPSDGFKVEFQMYRDSQSSNPDLVNVYYNTTNTLTGAYRLGYIYRYTGLEPLGQDQGWHTYSFSLPSGSGGDFRYLIFEGVSAFGYNMFIDEVRLYYDPPLPVELSTFYVSLSVTNHALLTWITQTETNMAGFRLYRGTSNDLAEAQLLSTFIPATNTTQPQTYVYHDTEPWIGGTYHYWLESGDLDGSSQYFGPISVLLDFSYNFTPNIPLVTELGTIYPNPFNPSTTISYSLDSYGMVEIAVYNIKGQLVRKLLQESKTPGNYRVFWDGTDAERKSCSSGQYQIVMRVGNDVYTRKAILLK